MFEKQRAQLTILKDQLWALKSSTAELTTTAHRLQKEVDHLTPVVNDLTKDVQRFEKMFAPHVAKINAVLQSIQERQN